MQHKSSTIKLGFFAFKKEKIDSRLHDSESAKMVLTFNPLNAMPSNADESGAFGEDCLSVASSAAARLFEEHRVTEVHGMECLLLWLFLDGLNKIKLFKQI